MTKYRVCLNTALSSVRGWVLQALEQCVQQAKKPDGSTPTTGPKNIKNHVALTQRPLSLQVKVTRLRFCTENSGYMQIR